jgi:hypothetical protein
MLVHMCANINIDGMNLFHDECFQPVVLDTAWIEDRRQYFADKWQANRVDIKLVSVCVLSEEDHG